MSFFALGGVRWKVDNKGHGREVLRVFVSEGTITMPVRYVVMNLHYMAARIITVQRRQDL